MVIQWEQINLLQNITLSHFHNIGMILQYSLSVYAINFFTFPAFGVRLINQQNGDCNDSRLLDAGKLTPGSYPIEIKLKGGQRMLMKAKIISVVGKGTEVMAGEGVVNFDTSALDSSLRVPIYDKKKGVEQVAICSIDFFVSGYQLDKNVSGVVDKSKSKIDDWRDHTEDAVYSQMSYTVESEAEQNNVPETIEKSTPRGQKSGRQIKPKQFQSYLKTAEIKQPKGTSPIISPKAKQQSISNKRGQVREGNVQSPLQNSAYLSESSSKRARQIIRPIKTGQSQRLPQIIQNSPAGRRENDSKKVVFESKRSPILQEGKYTIEDSQQDITLSPEQIRLKLRENQKLTVQLKRYIDRKKEREGNYSEQVKVHHNKIRRKNVKVEQINAYKCQNNFLKCFKQLNKEEQKVMLNLKAYKTIWNQIKDEQDTDMLQMQIRKIVISSVDNEQIAAFDASGYRNYCFSNYLKPIPLSIAIPATEHSLIILVMLQGYGQFVGVVGVQEGENMVVKLVSQDKHKMGSVLKKQQYRLCFDIKHETRNAKKFVQSQTKKDRRDNNNVSFRQQIQFTSPEKDIRSRIHTFSIQPWGYGQSYLNQLRKTEEPEKKVDKLKGKSVDISKNETFSVKIPSLSIKRLKQTTSNGVQTDKAVQSNAKQSNETDSNKKQDINKAKKKFISQNEYSEIDERLGKEKKNVKQNKKDLKENKKDGVDVQASIKKEIKQINRIRNGNRNNFHLSEKKRQEKPTIKQMWQKLLIKKKVEEQQLQHREQRKRNVIPGGLDSSKVSGGSVADDSWARESEKQDNNARLYGKLPGSSQVIEVNNRSRLINESMLPPLRTISVEINNISITQPQVVVEEERGEMAGKFIKLFVRNQMNYYTQIIFNGGFNSILWKLSGCVFGQLTGHEHLEIQIYKTIDNKISLIGKSKIRFSKLFFIRNNHIYNGKIEHNHTLSGEFTLGFQVKEHFPFQIVEEEEDDTVQILPNGISRPYHQQLRQSQPSVLSKKPSTKATKNSLESPVRETQKQKFSSLDFKTNVNKLNRKMGAYDKSGYLKNTLKRESYQRKVPSNLGDDSMMVPLSSELEDSYLLPNGLNK